MAFYSRAPYVANSLALLPGKAMHSTKAWATWHVILQYGVTYGVCSQAYMVR